MHLNNLDKFYFDLFDPQLRKIVKYLTDNNIFVPGHDNFDKTFGRIKNVLDGINRGYYASNSFMLHTNSEGNYYIWFINNVEHLELKRFRFQSTINRRKIIKEIII